MTPYPVASPDRFVTIDLGPTRLALAPGEVSAIDSALDLDEPEESGLACGLIDAGAGSCPVYALDDALELVGDPPPTRRVCAVFEHEGRRAGVLADAVGSVPGGALRLEPLPLAVQVPRSVVTGLAVHGEELLFVTTAARLVAWLGASAGIPETAA